MSEATFVHSRVGPPSLLLVCLQEVINISSVMEVTSDSWMDAAASAAQACLC